jgi:DNA-binding SARP family transcriptional activator
VGVADGPAVAAAPSSGPAASSGAVRGAGATLGGGPESAPANGVVHGSPEAPPSTAPVATPPATLAARVYVRCFGALDVVAGPGPGGPSLSPRGGDGSAHRPWEVLAFLASRPDGEAATERVLAAVWPDAAPDSAPVALRQALSRLRRRLTEQVPGLPGHVVRQERSGVCRLDRALVATDVGEFVRLTGEARRAPAGEAVPLYEAARALYRGRLLETPGYAWVYESGDDGVSPSEHFQTLHRRTTQALARLLEEAGEAAGAAALYEELVRADPARTDALHALLRLHHRLGDPAALDQTVRDLRGWLRTALGDADDVEEAGRAGAAGEGGDCAPDPETLRLYERLRADLVPGRGTSGTGEAA